jgi:CHAT domain-containing protein
MEPLVRHLQDMHLTQAVLIPSGYLALLPLHAAWTEQQGQRHYALDSICFSYAPAARILTQAQQAATTPDDTLLVINEPQPVRADRLPSTQAEADAVTVHFGKAHTLAAQAATCQAVQEYLPHAHIVHFSCHGGMDWDNPLQSGLLMANDELLTVQDVFDLHLEGAQLAVLSACETGMVGIDIPDEVVMLPSALLQAGFAAVISSLWSVSDASTAILMERFYYFWRVEQHAPAEALRRGQQWLRDTTNGEKRAYYEQFIPAYGGQPGLVPEPTARFFRRAFVYVPPEENRFAHPFYWAAFSYTGV